MISRKIGLQLLGTPPIPPLGQPRLVKLVEPSVEYAQAVRRIVGPDTLLVVRWYEATQRLDDPLGRAREWYDKRVGAMTAMSNLGPICFEGYNEIADGDAPGYEGARAYCAFEMERVRLMSSRWLSAMLLNASVGTPALFAWPVYEPLLDLARQSRGRHFVGLHEYWSDRQDMDNRWHVCRYWRPEVSDYLHGIPIAITEAGRDYIQDQGLPAERWGRPGWQLSATREEYLADLEHLGRLVEEDGQVVGVAVFQYGSNDSRWAPFDVSPIWAQVVDRYSQPLQVREPLPEEEPVPTATKVRWWAEEAVRQLQDMGVDRHSRAMQIMYSLVAREKGLLYRWERANSEG